MNGRGKTIQLVIVTTVLAFATPASQAQPSPYRPADGGYPRFESKQADAGVAYGHAADFPLPKTLVYSVSVDELLADGQAWVEQGYGGFFLTGIAGEWSTDIWAVDGQPWTVGAADETMRKVREATTACRTLDADVFLSTAFSHPFDWFDDVAWQHIEHRFRQMAIFARDSGCTGLAIDIEYINQQYHFNWEGYTYEGYTRRDLIETIRTRMTGVAEAMFDAFPDMVLLTLPEGMLSFGSHIQTAWLEVAASRNAPGGFHVCTEYTYRRPNLRYMLGHAWMIHELYNRLLSDGAKAYWHERGSIAEGIWVFGDDPDDFHGVAPSPDEFRQAFAASLMAGKRYNWIYSHNARPYLLGRETTEIPRPENLDAYLDVIAKREIVTDPEYVRIARALRFEESVNYEEALGLTIVPTFAGPREELEIGLMPVRVFAPSLQAQLREQLWDVGLAIFNGNAIDRGETFGTQTEWHLIGPFENAGNAGFEVVYPPEQQIDVNKTYDTPHGPVAWTAYRSPEDSASVDLTRVFQPAEEVCAYALCYVDSPVRQDVHIRVGANDGWKLWVDGQLVLAYPDDGRIILDREIVPVTLEAGVTPVLLKVCNVRKDWGFILRITTPAGDAVNSITAANRP